MNKKYFHNMLIGGHVSIAGGLMKAVEKGRKEGFNVLQIFATSPRSFNTKEYTDEEISEFRSHFSHDAGAKSKNRAIFKKLFLHAIYLINLGSDNERLRQLSYQSLLYYLNVGDRLGAVGTIVHLGTDNHREEIVHNIEKLLTETPKSQYLIIENMASHKRFGSELSDFEYIHKSVSSSRIGYCIDTQHLFASGVDVSNRKIFCTWLKEFDKRIGIDKLLCVHLNDSKTKLGSYHDQHENIGEGIIGIHGFRNICTQPLLRNKPYVLETPGFDRKGPDRENKLRIEECLQKG